MEKKNIINKKIKHTSACIALSSLLLITTSGCSKKASPTNEEYDKIIEIANIYSYGNLYQAKDNPFLDDKYKEKYSFDRDSILVFLGDDGQTRLLITYKQYIGSLFGDELIDRKAYVVDSSNLIFTFLYYGIDNRINKAYIGTVDRYPRYPSEIVYYGYFGLLDNYLTEEEKGKDSFYMEELIDIQNRMNIKEEKLTLK